MIFYDRKPWILAVWLVLGGVVIVGQTDAQTTLTGAGATFPYPLYSKWFDAYNKLHPEAKINYQSIGSGGGIRQVSDGIVDFGATDAPMADEAIQKAKIPLLHLPTVLGAAVLSYNTSGIPSGLNFTQEALAGIFLGEIKKWNDPKIAQANSKVKLPDKHIFVVHRSDGSGTTAIFTNYLSKVSLKWKSKVGSGTSVRWPVGIGGKGNEGVAALIQRIPFSMGYVSQNYAAEQKMAIGRVKTKTGQFVLPDLENITAAAASFEMPDDFRVMITDPSAENAYPISGFTWLLVPKTNPDSPKKKILLDFLKWILQDGQLLAPDFHYAPLPAKVVSLAEAAIAQLQ